MNSLKALAKNFLPPVIVQKIKSFRDSGTRFEGNFINWQEAASNCVGYDADTILTKVLEATLKVKSGGAAFERDSVLFDEIEFDWPIIAGLMWGAAQSKGSLNVLDFGGALGSSYFQSRQFLSVLPKVRWSVVEQEHFVRAGLDHVQDETLKFYSSIDDCLRENAPNIVLLSSVLQYLPEPKVVIRNLSKIGAQIILVDKTIINQSDLDSIHIQKVPKAIYEASYPCRSFSEKNLIENFAPDYELVSKFSSLEFAALDQINSEFNGYIFSKIPR